MSVQYRCGSDRRRHLVDEHPTLNGIDYLEVLDGEDALSIGAVRQKTLLVTCFKVAAGLSKANVRIDGGVRVTPVAVEWAFPAPAVPASHASAPERAYYAGLPDAANVLVIRTDSSGDYSNYVLSIVASPADETPAPDFDPILYAVEFSFKVDCPSEFDCLPGEICPPEEALPSPPIDYLARDYNSLRQVMLDRLAVTLPDWQERSPADMMVALVEVLAYAGDHLSYYQDAVATEAYLGTARQRISLRRHARLLDYRMHEGCNARVWATFGIEPDQQTTLAAGTPLLSWVPGTPRRLDPGSDALYETLNRGPEAFETLHDVFVCSAHNTIQFYTWAEEECCLPAGATYATLLDDSGDRLLMRPGDVLILQEQASPSTGLPYDADPAHRHAVRLTHVYPAAHGLVLLTLPPASLDALAAEGVSPADLAVVSTLGGEYEGESGLLDALTDAFSPAPVLAGLPELVLKHAFRDEFNVAYSVSGETLAGLTAAGVDEMARLALVSIQDTDYPGEKHFRDAVRSALGSEWTAVLEMLVVTLSRRTEIRLEPEPRLDPIDGVTATVDVAWSPADALPFSLCLSTDQYTGLAVAHGNVALADHGWTLEETAEENPVLLVETDPFAAALNEVNVTYRVDNVDQLLARPAHEALQQDPREALPAVALVESGSLATWQVRPDLLASDRFAPDFMAEVDNDRRVNLRFGDGDTLYGRSPAEGTAFTARYRVGSGRRGNIGAQALGHVVTFDGTIRWVDNPLPALGGTSPESLEEVRQYAPQAFRVQERAVTEADYAMVAERHPDVQQAVATRRWTGSWYTMFLTIDRYGGQPVDAPFEFEMRRFLARYRLTGHDLEIDAPRYVPLDIVLTVCVKEGYFGSDVKEVLLQVFSRFYRPDGRPAFFHPDNLTFGQPVYLSQVVAAAMSVPGVKYVEVDRFQRWGELDTTDHIDDGYIIMGRVEIAQLNNDPSTPELGKIEFAMVGGQ